MNVFEFMDSSPVLVVIIVIFFILFADDCAKRLVEVYKIKKKYEAKKGSIVDVSDIEDWSEYIDKDGKLRPEYRMFISKSKDKE